VQVSLRNRATNYRALLRKITFKDKASYASLQLSARNSNSNCRNSAIFRNLLSPLFYFFLSIHFFLFPFIGSFVNLKFIVDSCSLGLALLSALARFCLLVNSLSACVRFCFRSCTPTYSIICGCVCVLSFWQRVAKTHTMPTQIQISITIQI